MVRVVAFVCLAISGGLAAMYGYTTANSEAVGLLRALGWGATAFVGGCCPAWLFAHLDNKAYARAAFTGFVGVVCAAVTIGDSIAGISGSGDKYAAERAKVLASTNDARAELTAVQRERQAMVFAPASAEAVAAAREAVASAERLRTAECGPENEKRGPSCRKREADEQAKRDALSTVTANKAASDRAAALDVRASAIRARIDGAQAVQSSNPGAAALSRLLHVEVDDAISWFALLGALALELAGMASMMRADAQRPPASAVKPETATEPASIEVSGPVTAATIEPITADLSQPGDSAAADADTVGHSCLRALSAPRARKLLAAISTLAISSGAPSSIRSCGLSMQRPLRKSSPAGASGSASEPVVRAARFTVWMFVWRREHAQPVPKISARPFRPPALPRCA
jgi:hypothetical protein